jgi:REP element-mobilizing transposase RayT
MTPLHAVNMMKGYTAKCLFVLIPQLRNYYKKGDLWSPGKFVGSVGHITLDKAKQYIEAHHTKTLNRNPCPEA